MNSSQNLYTIIVLLLNRVYQQKTAFDGNSIKLLHSKGDRLIFLLIDSERLINYGKKVKLKRLQHFPAKEHTSSHVFPFNRKLNENLQVVDKKCTAIIVKIDTKKMY